MRRILPGVNCHTRANEHYRVLHDDILLSAVVLTILMFSRLALQIGESMHHILVPLVTKGMSDPCPRVRAAASLASVNLVSSMQQEQVMAASQSILSAAHTIMSAASSPSYVIYAATAALAVVCDTLADAIGKVRSSISHLSCLWL